jgi:hypothetical protein
MGKSPGKRALEKRMPRLSPLTLGRRCPSGGNSMTHLHNADATQEGGKDGQTKECGAGLAGSA